MPRRKIAPDIPPYVRVCVTSRRTDRLSLAAA